MACIVFACLFIKPDFETMTAEETRLIFDTFNLIDVDQDGIITNEDLVSFSETLTKTLGRTIWDKEGLFKTKAWL